MRREGAGSILDLGCGSRRAPGAFRVDRDPRFRPDLVHDLDVFPWPLPDDRFDRVLCHHVLEHLRDTDRALAEIHRVARNGARVEIVTPHFSSVTSWDDPTHLHHFSTASFDRYCTPGGGGARWGRAPEREGSGRRGAPFRILRKRLGFGRAFLNAIPRGVSRRSLRWYEKHLAFVFPARNLTVEMEVVKG